jgi:hypothetical protein
MARIYFFVDGFNLYHALEWCDSTAQGPRYYRKYKWTSLMRLANCYVTNRKRDSIVGVELSRRGEFVALFLLTGFVRISFPSTLSSLPCCPLRSALLIWLGFGSLPRIGLYQPV